MSLRSMLCSLAMLAGCGDASTGGDDAPEPDGAISLQLDPADCVGVAQNFAEAATSCGSPLPAGAQAALKGFCERGIPAAAACGGNPAAGLDCFVTADQTDWVCQLGEPFPACNGDLAASLGLYCILALGNSACASGIRCDFDADCSTGLECNGRTGQCFDKTAYCIGLPCEFDADCPATETCNGAEGACVGS